MTDSENEAEVLHLHVSIGGVTVEVEGPVDDAETWFEALREDYLGDIDGAVVPDQSPQPDESNRSVSQSTSSDSSEKNRTLAEFYQMTDGITKKDTALLTGWYIETHEGQDDFTKKEIDDKATSAKLTLGANLSRDLGYKVEDGHLAEVGERDDNTTYHTTISGEEYVKEELIRESKTSIN